METTRLILRPYVTGDEPGIYSFIIHNKEHLKQVLSGSVYNITSLDDVSQYVKKMKVGWMLRNYLCLGIWHKEHDQLVGEIVLFNIDWKAATLEIGNYIAKNFQNRGIITEAIITVTEYAFMHLKIKRIAAVCHVNNKAVHRVFIKCGYTITGSKGEYIHFCKFND